MRIVTYNVRGFRNGVDRVLGVVRALRPDVLLLQETGSRRSLRRFAVGASMRVASDLTDAWAAAERGDGSTFPASRPSARIDYLFVSSTLTVSNVSVGGEGSGDASDHLPVCVDIALGADETATTWSEFPEPDS